MAKIIDTNNLVHIDFEVTGMDCVGCANSIRTKLSRYEGITNVNVNFASETASIDYDSSKINTSEIASQIRELGYDVSDENIQEEEQEKLKQNNLRNQRYKIFTSAVFSVIIAAIAMQHMLGFHLNETVSLLTAFLLCTVVVFWCGWKFIKGAANAAKMGTSDMNTLISLGTLSAYAYSTVVTFNELLGFNISALTGSEVYFETAGMIVTFLLIGNYLEASLKVKSQNSIKLLKGLQAKTVKVLRNGAELEIPFRKVKIDDIVIINAGDKIPVDGIITEGYCVADESSITGESIPIEKKPGDRLISGTILKTGYVKLLAEKVGADTFLSKIITLVNEASNSKPQIQRLADKISAIFVPIVIAIAIITFAVWKFIINVPLDEALLYAVSVLIIACPCALGLASPMAVVLGIGKAAENGILFNDVTAIEHLNKVDTICFDKTGTLTGNQLKVKSIHTYNGVSEQQLLGYLLSVERYSNHPKAKSIVEYSLNNEVVPYENIEEFVNETGLGIRAKVNNKEVLIGSKNYIEPVSADTSTKEETGNMVYVSIDGKLSGSISFEDSLKEEASEVVKQLKEQELDLFMISGDNKHTAESIAKEAGIKDYSYRTMPDEKEKIISRLQSEGKNVAMVGDGINDAPALAKANVGIAMGTGEDIAIDTADVIVVKGDLRNIVKARKISSKTVRIIKQNIFWAFFYNAAAIPAAAGVLVPLGIVVSPVMAAMLMAFSDVVTVIGNSMRLKYIKLD